MNELTTVVEQQEIKRKLASVQVIESLTPIPGADKIVLAKMVDLGWECVVRKDEFNVRDQCVYFEVDAILPEGNPDWEFLREVKFRIKTRKYRKQVSMGLILPITILSKLNKFWNTLLPGEDVTDLLKVKKYLTPDERAEEVEAERDRQQVWYRRLWKKYCWLLFCGSKPKLKWPTWLAHTDEVRIQSYPKMLEYLRGQRCYVTTKMDGQSVSVFTNPITYKKYCWNKLLFRNPSLSVLSVCGRTVNRRPDNSIYWRVARELGIEQKLSAYRDRYAIQAEQCGPTIQKNKMELSVNKWYVYNIYDRYQQRYLDYDELVVATKTMRLEMVPIETDTLIIDDTVTIARLLTLATGRYSNGHPKEGIVVRPLKAGKTPHGQRLSFKVINPEFAVKEAGEKDE